jgi:hypothetical protein
MDSCQGEGSIYTQTELANALESPYVKPLVTVDDTFVDEIESAAGDSHARVTGKTGSELDVHRA